MYDINIDNIHDETRVIESLLYPMRKLSSYLIGL